MTAPQPAPAREAAEGESRPARPRRALVLALGLVIALGILLRLSSWFGTELWLDEYHSLLVAEAPDLDGVLGLVAADPHPPLYWVVLHLVLRLLGSDPLVARGLSFMLGVATLLLATSVALRRWGVPAAIVASTVLGGSALAIRYSAEIRPYAFVAFALLLGVLASQAAVDRPSIRTYLAQAFALALALGLNFFGVTLLAVGPGLALVRRKGRLVLHQAALAALAFLAVSPPLVRVATRLPAEANEYVKAHWEGRTAADALVAVGRDLLPSARWPAAHGPGARRTPIDPLLEGLAVAGALLAAAGASRTAREERGASERRGDGLAWACALLLGAAAALAFFSFAVGRPVVTPGRFAASFVPAAALLCGAAATWRMPGPAGAVVLALVAALNVGASMGSAEPGIRVDPGRVLAVVIRGEILGPVTIVSVGLTGTPLKYALRDRPDTRFASFPSDVDAHFGWWAPRKAAADPAALARDAEQVARRAVDEARAGRVVLLTGGDHPLAAPLLAALARSFEARPLHRLVPGAFLLSPKPPLRDEPPGPAPYRR